MEHITVSLKNVAKLTLLVVEAGSYTTESGRAVDISEAQAFSCENTTLYRPQDFPAKLISQEEVPCRATVRVVDSRTTPAAESLCRSGKNVALLNFASARNPGGGFLKGAKAQEEDLCRCSGLYPTLLTQPDYYASNRKSESLIYTDHLIYSPKVPFFKTEGRGKLSEEPFLCSVITAPAPNAAELRKHPDRREEIRAAFFRRWAMVLHVAKEHGHEHLVLGAWGCGAFGNEAEDSALAVRRCLRSAPFAESFQEVLFAIPERGKRSIHNSEVFQEILSTLA